MAESYTEITLGASGTNGVNNVNHGPFTFDYIDTGDIKVRVKVGSTWHPIVVSSVNTTTKIVTLAAAPDAATSADPAGAGASASDTLRIYRATSLSPIVDFQAGSRISEADLDNAYRQGLFAAQEVAEDANTEGGAGATTLTTNSVQLVHMSDESVHTAELKDDAVTAAKIADGQVGAAALASSIDLSSGSKEMTFRAGEISAGELATTLDLSSKTVTLPITSGEVLDKVSGICDGHLNKAFHAGGNLTWPDCGGAQDLSNSIADINGSKISYYPPTGTKWVEYEYNFQIAINSSSYAKSLAFFKFYMSAGAADSSYTEVTNAKFSVGNADQYGTRVHFKWVFPIGNTYYGSGSSVNTNKGAISTWTSARYLKLRGRVFDNTSDTRTAKLNQMYYWDDADSGSASTTDEWQTTISHPILTITALS
tara:strand:- start:1605 stop:2879 length:1275 start_codon:yes stop_codon:yes gene_type:complete